MATSIVEEAKDKLVEAAGGPARLQVISVLAAVLGLDMANMGTVSAVADRLKQDFSISNTEFGLLLAVVYFAGAIATLPMGVLVDRTQRKTVLLVTIALWTGAMILSGTATSYVYLLATRLLLGAVTAAAWPVVASLTGDFFPADERAAVYGQILAGELIGSGLGFFISGEVSSVLSWHWSFYAMALLSAVLVWVIWRFLPEPARGTQSYLEVGETDPYAASEENPEQPQEEKRQSDKKADEATVARAIVRKSGVRPRKELVLHEDPTSRSWWWAMKYFLRIPSYRLLVAASALAYYFFSGVLAFGMIYFTKHYGVAHGTVSALVIIIGLGALAGVIAGGRISEWLLRRGQLNIRVVLPAAVLLASIPFFGFGIWTRSIWLAVALMTVGSAILAMAIAPIDAARQDIMHPRLWGRAEAGRMALRSAFEGSAPLLFGAISDWIGGDRGLMWTFLIMLVPVVASSLFIIPGRKTYAPDVATAAASIEAIKKRG